MDARSGSLRPTQDQLITRADLALRWHCSIETIKRREKSGLLKAIRFSERFVRYRLSDILDLESGSDPDQEPPRMTRTDVMPVYADAKWKCRLPTG